MIRYISNDTPQSSAPASTATREDFDLFEYLDYLIAHWRFVAAACLAALLLGATTSLVMPKEYTAVATILIEPPESNDPRAATVVSPVYLESLKTYETLVSQSSLFAEAVRAVQLSGEDLSSLETLKRRVLSVNKLRDTRLLEVRVTLHDAKLAQRLASYMATRASQIQREHGARSDGERVAFAEAEAEQASRDVLTAQNALRQLESTQSLGASEAGLTANQETAARLQDQILEAEADLADTGVSATVREGLAARLAKMREQSLNLKTSIAKESVKVAAGALAREDAEAAIRRADMKLEVASNRLRDARAAAGSRSERLLVADAGVIPDRPSSPGAAPMSAGALVLALIGSLSVLTVRFAYRHRYQTNYGY